MYISGAALSGLAILAPLF